MLDGLDQTAVIVAAFGAAGLIGAASIPAWINRRSTSKLADKVTDTLGERNGRGPLVKMVADLQDHLRANTRRIERLEDTDAWQIRSLTRLEQQHFELRDLILAQQKPPAPATSPSAGSGGSRSGTD